MASSQQDFESSHLYSDVYEFVRRHMSGYDMSHDFNHVLRVLAMAKHILAEEQEAYPWKKLRLDEQAVILAALLHDVGDKKYAKPGEDSAQIIQGVLKKHGCEPTFINKVTWIVENVSYSNEIQQPKVVKAMLDAYPELAIVQDADRLDAIGAIGIARAFAYGASKMPGRGLHGSLGHLRVKLEKLESMMKTDTGKALAGERTRRVKLFRQWWGEEDSLPFSTS